MIKNEETYQDANNTLKNYAENVRDFVNENYNTIG